MNSMYMHEAVHIISVAASDIPDSHLLWYCDDATRTVHSKNGILEQIGRFVVQDNFSEEDGIYISNLAIAALKAGNTSIEIEKAIRAVRLTTKKYSEDPDNVVLKYEVGSAIGELKKMGGIE